MSGKYNPEFMKKFVNEQRHPAPTPQKALNPLPVIPEEAEIEENEVAVQPPRR